MKLSPFARFEIALEAGSRQKPKQADQPPRKFVGAYIPEEDHAALKAIAKANHRSLSGHVSHLIEAELAAQAELLAKRKS